MTSHIRVVQWNRSKALLYEMCETTVDKVGEVKPLKELLNFSDEKKELSIIEWEPNLFTFRYYTAQMYRPMGAILLFLFAGVGDV